MTQSTVIHTGTGEFTRADRPRGEATRVSAHRKRVLVRHLACAAAVAVLWATRVASAANLVWVGGFGDWADASNWLAGYDAQNNPIYQVPTASDTANITDGVAQITTAATAASEYIGVAGLGVPSVTQGGGTNNVGWLELGINGFYNQLSGSIQAGTIQVDGGYTCQYQFQGGTLSATTVIVGTSSTNGSGKFLHSGGNSSVGSLYLGYNSGSSGSYTLSGSGSLTSSGLEYVGYSGTGTFTQTGGSNIGNAYNALVLGQNSGSNGTYNLSGGTITLTSPSVPGLTYFVEMVGNSGTATFNQTGGTQTINQSFTVGYGGASHGTFNLYAGSLSVGNGEDIGMYGQGSFVQTGGTNTTQGLGLGGETGGNGAYSLQGGSLTATVIVSVGSSAGASGTFTLSGTGTLSANDEHIGDGGNGTFTQTGGTNTSNGFSAGTNSGATGTYNLSGGTLTIADEYVGYTGTGYFYQTGGTNTINGGGYGGMFRLGRDPGSQGYYTLSNGTLNVTAPGGEQVGVSGTGTFTQTGGTHTVNALNVGNSAGGNGSYSLAGTGTLNVSTVAVGNNTGSTGTFTQTGGTNTASNWLVLGYYSGSNGSYSMQGGNLFVGSEFIGHNGTGTFTQTAGTNTVNALAIGTNASGNGSYSLSGNNSVTVSSTESIGNSGTGTFTQTGGTNTASNWLVLGYYSGSNGSYSMQGGNLFVGSEFIGHNGTGTFTQTAGTNTVNAFTIGTNASGNGSYSLSGSGSLTTSGTESIGNSGSGTFTQAGGTNTVNNLNNTACIIIGQQSGSIGKYSLSTGSLTVSNALNAEYVGYSGQGTFNQTGGTHSLNSTSTALTIGQFPGSNGTYTLSAGTLTVGDTMNGVFAEIVGAQGAGTFNQSGGTLNATSLAVAYSGGTGNFNQTGGTNTVNNPTPNAGISIGQQSGSVGTYTLSAGSLTVSNALNAEYVGYSGQGTFNQTGGTHSLSSTSTALTIGQFPGSNGTYTLSAGTLTVSDTMNGVFAEIVGAQGAGTFNQSGGTLNATSLAVAYSGGTGSFNQTGGSLAVTGDEYTGKSGSGFFVQTGGTNTISGSCFVGFDPSGTGNYSLSGTGSLSAGGGEIAGDNGKGTFVQSGGNNTIGSSTAFNNGAGTYSDLILGNSSSALGTYTLNNASGANPNLAVYGDEHIGDSATGTGSGSNFQGGGVFNQSAGTHSVYGSLFVGYQSGSTGVFSLSGIGSLSVSGHENVGNAGIGTFNQSGGTHTILGAGGLQLGCTVTGIGTLNLSGGTLTTTNAYLGGSDTAAGGTGTLSVTGGAMTVAGTVTVWTAASTITLNGGTLTTGLLASNAPVGTVTLTDPTSGAALTINGASGAASYAGTITGTGSVVKTGGGSQTFAGPTNYTGSTTVTGGVLSFATVPSSRTFSVSSGGILQFGAFPYTGPTGQLRAGAGGTIQYAGTTLSNTTLFGPGSHNLVAPGTTFIGVNILNGANVGISANASGSMPAPAFSAVDSAGNISVSPGNSLTWDGGALSSAGTLTIQGSAASPATVNADSFESDGVINVNNNATLSNTLSSLVLGGGSRTYVGTVASPGGTINLNGNTLELNGGLLVNNGTISNGTVNVNYGSLLMGSGNITGQIAVNKGGQVSPGNSPGLVTSVSGSLGAGGGYIFEITDAAGTRGVGYDQWNMTGSLSINAGNTTNSRVSVAISSLDATDNPGAAANFNPNCNQSWPFIHAAGGITGFNAANFAVNSSGFTNPTNGGVFAVTLDPTGTNLLISYSAPQWNATGGGTWPAAGSWIGGAPTVSANFLGNITTPATITLDGPRTVQGLTFDNPTQSYTIAPGVGGTLTLNNGASPIAINVLSGAHTISAPLTLMGNATATISAGADLKLSGPLSATGTTLTKAGAGILELPNLVGVALNLSAGTTAALAGDTLLDLPGLTVAPGAILDLRSSDMVLRYSGSDPYAAYAALIQSGGITTSLIHPSPGTTAEIALVDNNELHVTTWHGDAISDGSNFNELLFVYTYAGDTNLDGVVDQSDYLNVIANMGKTNAAWFDGDLNGDGIVSPADLAIVTANLGAGTTLSQPLAAVFGPAAVAVVPEPGCLSVLALAGCALLRRRRHIN